MKVERQIPGHWEKNSWEEKAKENPLYAVMTMPEMVDSDPASFSEKHLELFFAKGQALADRLVMPYLSNGGRKGLVVEYGCGAGRILNALVERGVRCIGVDISPTMLDHCRRLVPGVEKLVCVDSSGRIDLPDECASLVFSYAVLQHIEKLSEYEKAISEMCRVLWCGGKLILQLNCEDFSFCDQGQIGRTENFETYSVHYVPGSHEGKIHKNTTWSGVYIGFDRLKQFLFTQQVSILDVRNFNIKKPRSVLVVGVKKAGRILPLENE